MYWEMQENPELEFEFYLAQKLSMTVAQLRQMGNEEFVGWTVYYGRLSQKQELASKSGRG